MAIADLSSYKQALAAALLVKRFKAGVGGGTNARIWSSDWRNTEAVGAVPTTAANVDATTLGSLIGYDPPASGVARLAQIEGIFDSAGFFILADRLAQVGGVVTNPASPPATTTVNVGPPGREASGAGVHAAFEIYTQVGVTATTVHASYTNQAGTAGRTSPDVAIGGSGTGDRDSQRMIMMPLQEGDTGVRSVESVTMVGTTGPAGNIGVTLYKPLVIISPGRGAFLWDGVLGGGGNLPDLTGRCLFLLESYNLPGNKMLELRIVNA